MTLFRALAPHRGGDGKALLAHAAASGMREARRRSQTFGRLLQRLARKGLDL